MLEIVDGYVSTRGIEFCAHLPDESFDLVVERSKSERFLYIAAESTTMAKPVDAPVPVVA